MTYGCDAEECNERNQQEQVQGRRGGKVKTTGKARRKRRQRATSRVYHGEVEKEIELPDGEGEEQVELPVVGPCGVFRPGLKSERSAWRGEVHIGSSKEEREEHCVILPSHFEHLSFKF